MVAAQPGGQNLQDTDRHGFKAKRTAPCVRVHMVSYESLSKKLLAFPFEARVMKGTRAPTREPTRKRHFCSGACPSAGTSSLRAALRAPRAAFPLGPGVFSRGEVLPRLRTPSAWPSSAPAAGGREVQAAASPCCRQGQPLDIHCVLKGDLHEAWSSLVQIRCRLLLVMGLSLPNLPQREPRDGARLRGISLQRDDCSAL